MLFDNNRGTSRLQGHALCLTDSADNAHFNVVPGRFVLEVSDIAEFARKITAAAKGGLGNRFFIDRVAYADDRSAVGLQPMPKAHPFRKRLDFEPEQELRIYWPNSVGPHVDIDDSGLKAHLKALGLTPER